MLPRAKRLDEGWHIVVTRRMNGEPLVVAQQYLGQPNPMAVLDPRTFEVIHAWTANGYASWMTRP